MSQAKPRLQLLIHSYWPESTPPQRRWQRLTESLRADGWEVDVITPAANERYTPAEQMPTGAFTMKPQEGPAGESIRRTRYLLLRNSRVGRFLSDAVSSVMMVPRAVTAPRPDVVLATVPALPVICAGWLAARLRRAPLVVDMRDAWPELAREAEVRAGPAGRLMETVVTSIQRRAELVVTVTAGFAERLRDRDVDRVETISNGVTLEQIPELEHRSRRAGELRVAYLGNHGESQALETVIRAVRSIYDRGEVEVTLRLVGSGTQKEQLKELAQGCPAVEFHDAVHGEQVWDHYRWSDTALVSLRTDWASFAWTVPSKTFELMGLGKHITATVTGEAAEILAHAENVAVVDSSAEALVETFTELARDPESTPVSSAGRRWVAEHADLPRLGERYSRLLKTFLRP
ncbi:glycosyltransferase family 4 protein [Nesterenkonia cremea]|uniref:D-inositol 3-phosphate glycosyltransferase n=1 Tax=Nesterenkonia cremea TaxID=1882340 RepID=A0A917ANZ9_9MICC|nr:glycosyltransferase family 4 protein [Nesterenkonia cremea]GGE62240.1 glycosyltransferase WbuB [Nesterenkonia cremea]